MLQTKSVQPTESPDSDPLARLIHVLLAEGYVATEDEEEWQKFGERTFRRPVKVLFARGETVFVLIRYPELTEKVIQQAMDAITHVYRARSAAGKALSVLQATTVYVCIVVDAGTPHTAILGRYIRSFGGAVLIPVILNPEINQVVYPRVEERIGASIPRVEYLQWILGERRDPVNIHRQTARTFWVSVGVVGVLLLGLLATLLL
jgi:hypothetical protein